MYTRYQNYVDFNENKCLPKILKTMLLIHGSFSLKFGTLIEQTNLLRMMPKLDIAFKVTLKVKESSSHNHQVGLESNAKSK